MFRYLVKGLADISLSAHDVAYRCLGNHVRDLILSGQLLPGKKLPTTQALARQWHVDAGTVHKALTGLVKEGFLIRQMRKGTFVRARPTTEQLTAVGIYHLHDFEQPIHSLYLESLQGQLFAELERQHIHAQVLKDPRAEGHTGIVWPALMDLARDRRIQGLLSLASGYGRHRWLDKLPVPVVHFGTMNVPNHLEADVPQMYELALGRLAEQGCRSVGLICPYNTRVGQTAGRRNPGAEALTAFMDLAGQFGLTVKNQWMRTATENVRPPTQLWFEQFGYDQFQALWTQPQHPDGLVAYDDCVSRGVITALLEARVRVPAELKLVLHRNAEVGLLCPLPVAVLEHSIQGEARAAVAMLQKLYRGEPVTPVRLPCRLVTTNPSVEGS